MIKASLLTFWITSFLLTTFLNIGNADAKNSHCRRACGECPSDSTEICGLTPFIHTYSCMCQVHTLLCAIGSKPFIFHEGPCKHSFSGLSKGMFQLKGSTVWKIGSKSRKYSNEESRRGLFYKLPNYPRRFYGFYAPQKQLSHEKMCDLFFDQDLKFMKKYKTKHFQCGTVDPNKIEKIPLLPIEQ